MSQAGLLNASISPIIATSFVADIGVAVPAANILEIRGSGSVDTSGALNVITVNVPSPLPVAHGGTGLATITSHGLLLGNGVGNIQVTAEPTDGQILIGKTGDFPQLGLLTAGYSVGIINAPGSITINAFVNSRYVVDGTTPNMPYPTIQSAIDAAHLAGGNANIWIRIGTYNENLTLYDTINLEGADAGLVIINGIHTPPNAGEVTFIRCTLQSATDVILSAAAGTAEITFSRCLFNVTNGYICNLTNWTGELHFHYCLDNSTSNGIVYNTAGAEVHINHGELGKGTKVLTANGNVTIFSVDVWCPIRLIGTGTSTIQGGSIVHGNVTIEDTHRLTIGISGISSGAAQAITHNSGTTLVLNNVVVKSTFAPAIGGTGTIQLMNVSFPNNYDLAGTITNDLTGAVKSEQTLSENIINMEDSGFESWAAGAPYFDDTTLGTFNLLVGGVGYIKNERIEWTAQSISGMTTGNLYYIYIDSDGVIGKTATRTSQLFIENIVLFQCLRDSTPITNIQYTSKENHPYAFQVSSSNYLHQVVGSVIENANNGANIVLNGTQKIQINGTDYLSDHGLRTTIPDSAGVGETWNKMYTTAGGKWATYSRTDTFTGHYNNAGTVTALDANKYGVYRLYIGKDSLNITIPSYYAILDTTQYNNLASANTAIANGTPAQVSNELANLEIAQLGFIIFAQASNSIVSVIIAKATLKSTISTGGTSTASLVNTNVALFDGILSAADTNVQAALETIDEFGKNLTDHAVVVGNGNGLPLGVIPVGATGELLTGVTGADPVFATSSSGNFTFTNAVAATPRVLTVENTDGDAGSSACFYAKAAFPGGDAYSIYGCGANYYSVGQDSSDSRYFKITTGADPSSGTVIMRATNTGVTSFLGNNVDITRDTVGAGTVSLTISNTDNTAAASNAANIISVGGTTSTGDPHTRYVVTGGYTWSVGVDNSDSDIWKVVKGDTPSSLAATFQIDGSGHASFYSDLSIGATSPFAAYSYFYLVKSVDSYVSADIYNSSNTASAYTRFSISVAGDTAQDPYLLIWKRTPALGWAIGMDNSDTDSFKINLGDDPSSGSNYFKISTAGVITLGNDLDVTEGGTGVSTLTQYGVLIGEGAADIQATAAGATGQLLTATTGANPSWTTATYPSTCATGDILYGSAANVLSKLTFVNTATRYLANTGGGATIPAWAQVDLTNGVTGTLPVGNGGLGVANPTDHSVLVGSGNTAVTPIAVGNTGELLIGATGADPAFGVTAYGNFTFSNLTPATPRTLTVANADNAAGSTAALHLSTPAGGDDCFVTWELSGGAGPYYSIGVDNSDSDKWKLTNSSGPSGGDALIAFTTAGVITLFNDLDVSEGGTGVSTLTSHGILLGNGAGDIQATAEPSNGQLLIGKTGSAPVLATLTDGAGITITEGAGTITIASNYGDPVTVDHGGTGLATITDHGVMVGSGVGAVTPLAVGATGTVLAGTTGADPSFTNNVSATSNFYFSSPTAGVGLGLFSYHTDNTNTGSHAGLLAEVGGTSGGDPYVRFFIDGSTAWSIGIDNSDSDILKIVKGDVPSSTTASFQIDTSGNVGIPTTLNIGTLTPPTVYTYLSLEKSSDYFISTDLYNSSNTSSAYNRLSISVAGSTAQDPYILFWNRGVVAWAMGMDNSDADTLRINIGDYPSVGTAAVRITTVGEMTKASQPSFLAYLSSSQYDVTGDSTSYTVPFDAEIWDQNNDYDTGTYNFTAPVTGRYFFQFSCYGRQLDNANIIYMKIDTSNRTYDLTTLSGYVQASTDAVTQVFAYADMDAADVANCKYVVAGGSKIVDVLSSGVQTSFSGELSV